MKILTLLVAFSCIVACSKKEEQAPVVVQPAPSATVAPSPVPTPEIKPEAKAKPEAKKKEVPKSKTK